MSVFILWKLVRITDATLTLGYGAPIRCQSNNSINLPQVQLILMYLIVVVKADGSSPFSLFTVVFLCNAPPSIIMEQSPVPLSRPPHSSSYLPPYISLSELLIHYPPPTIIT